MNCSLIILAGGKGERMGYKTHFSAKPAFLAYDRPVLTRLIEQAWEVNFREIYISTNPAFFSQIQSLVSSLGLKSSKTTIKVIKSQTHALGSLEALENVLRLVKNSRCLMCLGDIFFLANPFPSLVPYISKEINYLGVAEPFDIRELAMGGIIHCQGKKITSIAELPQKDNQKGLRWSGLALFNRKQVKDLNNFLSQSPPGSPEGDFFEFYRKQGNSIYVIPGPDFVNVNTADDLLLAYLYAAQEAYQKKAKLNQHLRELIQALRINILSKS